MMIVYHYPKCSTCQKALKWLREQDVAFVSKDIVTETPSREQLSEMIMRSGLPIQKFFNTSGIKYREMGLSSKLKEMDDEEKLDILASDGMLIKRPLISTGEKVVIGFKQDVYGDILSN